MVAQHVPGRSLEVAYQVSKAHREEVLAQLCWVRGRAVFGVRRSAPSYVPVCPRYLLGEAESQLLALIEVRYPEVQVSWEMYVRPQGFLLLFETRQDHPRSSSKA